MSNSFINQSLIDKRCSTNSGGVTFCTTHLITMDPTIKNLALDVPTPITEMYPKFPISNVEFHSTNEILSDSPNCTICGHDNDDYNSSNIDELLCPSAHQPCTFTYCHTDKSFVSRVLSINQKIYQKVSNNWKTKCWKSVI